MIDTDLKKCVYDGSDIVDYKDCYDCFFYYDCHVDIVKIKENNSILSENTDKFVENVDNMIKKGGSE